MQLLLQASPLIDKLKHWQRAISFNEVQLTTTQKVVLWSIGVVGTSAVVVGVLSRYLARRRAKPILNPRIQRAINKRISRMRSPNGGMGSVASSGGRSSPLGFSERLSVASGSIGSGRGDAATLSPQQLGVMEIQPSSELQPLVVAHKMAPPSQVIRKQLEILVEFLEENKEMFRGITPSKPMAQNVRDKWFTISEKLNAVEDGCLKSPERWKKYWFEWRHRCRKKAAGASICDSKNNRMISFNDLEIRLLQVTDKGFMSSVTTSIPESFMAEDSDSQPLENIKVKALPIRKKKSRSDASSTRASQNHQRSDDDFRPVTPPPKWALEIEERRIAAEERMAAALEAIASVMQAQEERQTMLHERLTDSVASIAGTVQDINSSLQESLQRLNQINPIQQNGVDCKGNFAL